jgi:1-deoxy-D-xylulose-5-phosphate reductoisomerase
MKRKRVVILGATGSIGESSLKVAQDIPSGWRLWDLRRTATSVPAAAANKVRPESVCLVDKTKLTFCGRRSHQPRIFAGEEGLREIAALTNADMVLVAMLAGGLRPALAAIEV